MVSTLLNFCRSRRRSGAGTKSRSAARARMLSEARAVIQIVVLAAALSPQSIARASDSFRDLQIAYRCEVVRRLEQIHAAGDPKVERDRYIAVSVARRPQIYVQCIFHDANAMAYCEAASGFYLSKPDEPRKVRASERTIAALAQLGFDTDDAAGIFKTNRRLSAPPDFNALADLILRALHDGYGVRAATALKFNAPFAPDMPTSCVPMS